jgi:hypothetical protein
MTPLTGQSARPRWRAPVRGGHLLASKRVVSPFFNRLPLRPSPLSLVFFAALFTAFSVIPVNTARAAAFTSTQAGNWDVGTTWGGACTVGCAAGTDYPGAGDTATIAVGPVTANVDIAAPGVAITVNAFQALTINSGVTLTATTVVINDLATITNNGTMTVSNLTGGSASGTWIQGTDASLTYSGASITPDLNASASGNTVTYNGAAAQTMKGATYYDLVIDNAGQTATVGPSTVVDDALAVNAGGTLSAGAQALTVQGTTDLFGTLTMTGSGTKTFVGLVIVESGGTWTNTTYAVNFQGGLKNQGTFTAGTGIQTFDTNNQAITGQDPSFITIPNLTVNGVTLTNNGHLIVTTTFSGTGSVTQGPGARLGIRTSTVGPTLNASATDNTVGYTVGAQSILPAAYYHLILTGNGNKTAPSTMSVAGNFAINPYPGDTATFVNNSGTVTFDGSGSQSFSNLLGNTTFYRLTINNSGGSANPVTLSSPVTVNDNLTISDGTLSDGGNLITGNGAGILTIGYGAGLTLMTVPGAPFPAFGSYSIDAASTVTYGGAGDQTIASDVAYGTLALGGSGTKTAPAGTLTIRGNYTNTAVLNANGGTVLFNGSIQQTLSGAMTGASAFHNLTVTNTSGVDDASCGDSSFVPGIIFSAGADATNYTITTGSVRVQYLAGATYTFANVNWNGQSKSTPIFFRSSLFGSPWHLNVTGSQTGAPPPQTGVGFLNVADSDASGHPTITAVNSIDCTDNVNWTFITLSEPLTITLTPSSAPPNTTALPVAMIGANYVTGATVVFNVYNGSAWVSDPAITGLGSCANDGTTPTTKINCTISISAGAVLGYRQVIVTNPDGGVAPPAYFYVGSITSTAMIVYGTSSSSDPKFRLLQPDPQPAGSWTAELGVGSGSGAPRWAVLRASPLSAEKVLGVLDSARRLTLLTWGGNGWWPPVSATLSSGPTAVVPSTRSFDLAYEQQSGRALAVYGVGGSAFPHYRIWDGVAWGEETTIATALNTATVVAWVRLVPQPGGNQIVLLYGDFSGAVNALVWDGSSFGHEQLLTTNAASTQVQVFDGAAEQYSCAADDAAHCQVMVVWATSTSNTPLYQTWNGTAWGSVQSMPIALTPNAGDLRTVRLAADPSSDRIAAGVVSVSGQLSVSQWDGTTWETTGTGTPQVIGAIPPGLASRARPFDLVWLGPQGSPTSRLMDSWGGVGPQSNSWTAAGGWVGAPNLNSSTVLRAQWHLDETGSTLADSSGNGNSLTLSGSGATAGQAGILNNAVLFAGGSASTASNPASLNLTGSTLTMAAWVYPTAFPASGIILNKENAYMMGINNGLLQAAVMTNSGSGCAWSWVGSTALSLQTWQHVAVTYDGTNLRFYVNGLLQQTVALTGTLCSSINAVMIGARPSGSPFIGRIDEVAVTSGITPPLADLLLDADRISQDLVVGALSQLPSLGADYGTGLFWNQGVQITAAPSGPQPVFTDTFYPQSFSLSYERNLTQTRLTVLSASPASSPRGQTQSVTITGTQFDPAATVSILCTLPGCVNGVTNPLSPTSVTSTSLTVDIPIASTATPGLRNIQVTNPTETAVGYNLFTVTSIVVTSTVCPDNSTGTPPCALGPGAANQPVVINGSGFNATSTVSFSGTGITQNGSPVVSGDGDTITINITIAPDAATGLRNVTVTNTAPADSVTANSLFSIVPGPTVTSVSPTGGAQGATFPCSSPPTDCVTVNGTGFQPGLTTDFGFGITVTNPCQFISSTQLYCALSIASNAVAGYRTVTVTNPNPPAGNAGSGSNSTAFQVLAPPPVVTDTDCGFGSPCQLAPGVVNRTVTVNGTNFSNVGGMPTVSLTGGASGEVQVVSVTCNLDGNGLCVSLAVTVNVSVNASVGLWDVTVTNPAEAGGLSGTGVGLFEVAAPPTITSLVPNSGAQGASNLSVTINGANFQNGATVTFKIPDWGSDALINQAGASTEYLSIPTTFVSSSQLIVAIDIGTAASLGGRDLILTNPNGGSATDMSFTVTAGSTASCPGGGPDLTVSSGTVTLGADATCTNVTVNGGAILQLNDGVTFAVNSLLMVGGATAGTIQIGASGSPSAAQINAVSVVVNGNGLIDASGTGCGPSTSYDETVSPPVCVDKGFGVTPGFGEGGNQTAAGGGAGYGGAGGAGGVPGTGQGGYTYGSSISPLELGSGGGNAPTVGGGAGGGGIKMVVNGLLTMNGTIRTNGANGAGGARTGGGGSGGAIYLLTADLDGAGMFQADGGDGGDHISPGEYGGGGGGGGRIAIYVSGTNSFSGSPPSCEGGAGGTGLGGSRSGQAGSAGSCFITSSTVTTLGDGINPLDATVAPGSADQSLDQFTLVTTAGTDSVTALTVTTTNTGTIDSMTIMSDDLSTQYFGTVSSPSVNAWNFSGGTPIPVGVTSTAYRVVVTFKNDATLTSDVGMGTFPVTGTVATITSTNTPAGSDATSATITVDNQPPADAVWGTVTPGNNQVILNWSNPTDADFAQVVILRNTVAFTTEAPTDGVMYAQGNTGGSLGSSVVRYVGSLQSFTDTGLTNGTSYYYKIFSEDSYGNYAAGAQTGPVAPTFQGIIGTGNCPNPGTMTFTISSNTTCTGDLTIAGGAVLTLSGDITLNVTGTVWLTGAGSEINAAPTDKFVTIETVDLTVDPGALIDANGTGCGPSMSYDYTANPPMCVNKGFGATIGFGEGADATVGAGGGGYGGTGGDGGVGSGGYAYGSAVMPLELGSGGGSASNNVILGGSGGGALNLHVSGTLTVNGTIGSNGADGTDNVRSTGGGSGGSLFVVAGTLAGAGTFQANGGKGGDGPSAGDYGGGGGGGGRIAVYYTGTNSFGGTRSCDGGAGGTGSPSSRAGQTGSTGTCPAPSLTTLSTTLGDGINPLDATVAPGSADQSLDQFTLVTTAGADAVTALTVTTANTGAIASMKIMSDDLSTPYFTTVVLPSGNNWMFSGGANPSLPVGVTGAAFRVVVTFKDQATLDGLGKVLYPVTGVVTIFTSTNPQAGSDATSATITVDNLPPANATWGTITPGDMQNVLTWANPTTNADSSPLIDFARVVILRNTVAFTTEAPTDGVMYAQGSTGGSLGSSVVRYVGSLQTFTDTGLTNGTSYYYKIFAEDNYGNYSAGVQAGPETPAVVPCSSISVPSTLTQDTTCTGDLTFSSGMLTLQGDITLTVTGNLSVTGTAAIVANPTNTFVGIVASNLTLGSGALIDANGTGCGASLSFNVTTGSGCVNKGSGATAGFGEGGDIDDATGAGGAGFGGAGGAGTPISASRPGGAGGNTYGLPDLSTGIMLGSGGGNGTRTSTILGGAGGGAIKLVVSGTLTVDGTIRADGSPGTSNYPNPSGGGSGGSLYIDTYDFAGAASGLIQANGGAGGVKLITGGGAGGGGGGRIVVKIQNNNAFLGSEQVLGGAAGGSGATAGQVGTTVINSSSSTSCDYETPGTYVISSALTCTNLTVINGATLILGGDFTLTVTGNVLVGTGSTIVVQPASTYVRIVAGNITVDAGASINADGTGCGPGLGFNITTGSGCTNSETDGPGQGLDATTGTTGKLGGGGGGAGGAGGARYGQTTGGGAAYGEVTSVILGSGGGDGVDTSRGNGQGGAGGGALDLCVGSFTSSCTGSGTLTVNGTISANGLSGGVNIVGDEGGGGGGGSLKITAGTLAGSGLLQANGGNGGPPFRTRLVGIGGGGAGGRIYINAGIISLPLTIYNIQAWGGLSYQNISPGTAGSLLVMAGSTPPAVTLSGGGTLDDVFDGSSDGTQTYSSLTVLGGPVGADSRTFGTFTFSTSLHLLGALNGSAGMIVNGTLTADGPITLTGGTATINGPLLAPDSVVTVAGATNPALQLNGDQDSIVGSLVVGSASAGSGTVVLAAAGTTIGHAYSHLTVTNSITVNSGGVINADGTGCGPSLGFNVTTGSGCTNSTTDGPGQGMDHNGNGGGGGGGFGGGGGTGGRGGAGGAVYGDANLTTMMLGSGGGNNSSADNLGGIGGGAIKLDITNALTVNGRLSVNGTSDGPEPTVRTTGGGSGGSLYINAGALTGSGEVQANGGNGGVASLGRTLFDGGGGGGGRIVINAGVLSTELAISVAPGSGASPTGSPGTVVTTLTMADTTPPASADVTASVVPIGSGPCAPPLQLVCYTDRALLTWTAVGDDGTTGTASSYALGYSTAPITTPITNSIFNGLTPVSGLGAPQLAGSPESFTVAGLTSNQSYNFVLKVCDEVPNCSFSNVASVMLPLDTIPPAAITDLQAGTTTTASVPLSWNSPGDDGGPAPCPCGTPKYYIVKYSTTPINNQTDFDSATTFNDTVVSKGDGTSNTIHVTGGIAPQEAGLTESLTVIGLSQNTLYDFAVEAVDEVGNQSPFGVTVSAMTEAVVDTTPPGPITNLQVISVTDRSAMLTWTAQGDDGSTGGPATTFDLRYSPFEIIAGSAGDCVSTIGFDQTSCPNGAQVSDLLHQVTTDVPVPGQPGAVQLMTVNMCEVLNGGGGGECIGSFQHATSNTNYFFAIRVIDDAGLMSTLGTLTNTNASDPIDPACDGSGTSQNCNLRTDMRVDPKYAVLVSVPLQGPLSPTALFGPLDGVMNWCGANDQPCLYKWLSTGLLETDGSYQLMDGSGNPCVGNCVTEGEGYYFFTNILSLLDYTGTNVSGVIDGHFGGVTLHVDNPLQQGMNLIGNPFKKNVLLQDTHIVQSGGGSCTLGEMTFAEAVTAGVIGNAIYVWTGAAEIPVVYNDAPPAIMQPWQGYEFFVEDDVCSYELLIPQPS